MAGDIAHQSARRTRGDSARLLLVAFVIAALCAVFARSPFAASSEEPLQFRITDGRVLNAFHQQGPVAAHLLLSSGTEPRLLVAFPAGNSGVGVWFQTSEKPVHWTLDDIASVSKPDARGRVLRGIVAKASVDGPLIVREAVLSSIRVLRDYQINGEYPREVKSSPKIEHRRVEWSRPRLDGAPGYVVAIAVANGEVHGGQEKGVTLAPSANGEPMRLTITALTGDTPLTPLGASRLLGERANDDPRSEQVLSFLSYEEKFLAGSWRFNTYFGRDTLMSLALLMRAMEPEALERGLMSVLERLAQNGEVAHEEDIGEFAILRHRKEQGKAIDTPIYDYKMIDDDYMLAPVAAAYVFDHGGGRARAKDFLARRTSNGESVGSALARNFVWVAQSARSFARAPEASKLISLKPDQRVGQWRDSEEGLAGGRYPFDVNAVLVPAALTAIAKFVRSGLLNAHLADEQRDILANADTMAAVWAREASSMFRVRLSSSEARSQIAAYAQSIGVSPTSALGALPNGDLVLNAIALDSKHEPIPVLHSDGGFALLLQDPPAARVDELVESMLRPFPAGLLTDVGLLVANPAFAGAKRQSQLDRAAYHGTVVWSWQQALLAAGLDRQIARKDLPAESVARLRKARERLWSAIENTRELRASELWSWRYGDGRYEAAPFGQNQGDADESNAAQLWSTVYLAVSPPRDSNN